MEGQDQLPTKEGNLFKQLIKLYECKNFKKALKLADKILEKFPKHGETLSMKGLILSYMGQIEQALAQAKIGLMANLKSGMCWHTLGLIHKSERNYDEASKCFAQAHKLDQNSGPIVRDLSLLQLQSRKFQEFKGTRLQVFKSKPKQPVNWMAYILGLHLCKNYDQAIKVIDSYMTTMTENVKPYEIGELYIYKALILEEKGDCAAAVEVLKQNEAQIKDKFTLKETLAKIQIKAGETAEAEEQIYQLLDRNAENRVYYAMFDELQGDKTPAERVELYKTLAEKYPASKIIQKIMLEISGPEHFSELFRDYVMVKLQKGIPSLAYSLKKLYQESFKAESMGTVIEELLQSIPADKTQSPCTYMWLLNLAAHHYYRVGTLDRALELATQAIEHTPTVPDLYITKGKILYKLGQKEEASAQFDEGRKLDLADRYLNNKAAKYRLRINDLEGAYDIMALFSKEGTSELNVHDMQSMWYELECADAAFRTQDYTRAVQEYEYIEKHLVDMYEDQFDFHMYCLRKHTMNSYTRLLRFEDSIFNNANFKRAGLGLINCHLLNPECYTIEKASTTMSKLIREFPNDVAVHEIALQLYTKKEKWLLAARSALFLRQNNGNNTAVTELKSKIEGVELAPEIKEVLDRHLV